MAAATRKTVTFVTGNENKLREVRAILGEDAPFALEARAVDLPELQGEPEDIADVILFLASDAARYMCGALVEVNGGKPVV